MSSNTSRIAINSLSLYINMIVTMAVTLLGTRFVLEALGETVPANEFDAADKLSKGTNTKIPTPIAELKDAAVRFSNVCEKNDMDKVVLKHLGINL